MKTAYLTAVAVAAVVGFATPAAASFAGPVTVTTGAADCLIGTGKVCNSSIHAKIGSTEVGYAGPLTITVGAPVSEGPLIAFCDDLKADIALGHSFGGYFVSDPATPSDVFNYLAVPQLTAQKILGLTAEGTFLADGGGSGLTPNLGAAFQMAIWELEYGIGTATLTGDSGFQTTIDGLIADALGWYTSFTDPSLWSVPWTFSQLEDPCNTERVGLVNKNPPQGATLPGGATNPNCQNHQGLIVAIPGVPLRNVPEPITLSLFGAGLAGVATYRRRRKNVA